MVSNRALTNGAMADISGPPQSRLARRGSFGYGGVSAQREPTKGSVNYSCGRVSARYAAWASACAHRLRVTACPAIPAVRDW